MVAVLAGERYIATGSLFQVVVDPVLQVLGNAVRIERVVPSVETVGAEPGDDHLFEEFTDGRKLAERADLAESLRQDGVLVRVRQPGDDAAARDVDLRVRQGLVLTVRHGRRVVGLPVQRVDDVSVRSEEHTSELQSRE